MMNKWLFLSVFAAVIFPVVAFSQNVREKENRKAKLEREIAIIDKQLRDNADKSSAALMSLSLIRKNVADRKSLVEESDRQLSELQVRINSCQAEADKCQALLDTLSQYYARLIKSAYKNRDPKVWYMYILASDNVGQAFKRAIYLKNLSSQMNVQGEKIKETRALLEERLDSLEILKEKQVSLRVKRQSELLSLQKEESRAAGIVSDLRRNKTRYQRELASKKRQVEALNREIERIIASAVKSDKPSSSSGKTPKIAIDTKLDVEFSRNKGRLPWPADGPVVDHFGQHYHPVFKSVKLPFNNWVTVALSPDASVRAVFDGLVKQIVVMPGYNKCVLVQHGNYFSFYCKLKSVSVKAGDKVRTGDVIGVVDTIDGATLLHFQIWKGTVPQNPELWLK